MSALKLDPKASDREMRSNERAYLNSDARPESILRDTVAMDAFEAGWKRAIEWVKAQAEVKP